jgi:hypothetical protein
MKTLLQKLQQSNSVLFLYKSGELRKEYKEALTKVSDSTIITPGNKYWNELESLTLLADEKRTILKPEMSFSACSFQVSLKGLQMLQELKSQLSL